MTEEKRDNAIILILYLITTLILCVVSYNQALMKIENELKTGAIRVYDKRYICDYVGTYVSDERFIPKEVTIDILPDDIKKQLKEIK